MGELYKGPSFVLGQNSQKSGRNMRRVRKGTPPVPPAQSLPEEGVKGGDSG